MGRTVKNESANPYLSLVVPMYNEQEVIPVFFDTIKNILGAITENYEIICVNDGSSDGTADLLDQCRADDPRVKVICLSRNFGKDAALTAGLDHVSGDAVVVIDADLQDPPELIADFVEKWREGYDVVYGQRRSRKQDTWFKRTSASLFYSVLGRISGVGMPRNVGDFRLMDRRVVDALASVRERNRFMKGLLTWVGYKQTPILFDRPDRSAGETKYNLSRMMNFALDGITGFSTLPLRIAGYLGISVACFSLVFGVYLIVKTLVGGVDVPGWASLMVVMLLLGGVQLTVLGIIGEYIGRIYQESKMRPLYLVDKAEGFD